MKFPDKKLLILIILTFLFLCAINKSHHNKPKHVELQQKTQVLEKDLVKAQEEAPSPSASPYVSQEWEEENKEREEEESPDLQPVAQKIQSGLEHQTIPAIEKKTTVTPVTTKALTEFSQVKKDIRQGYTQYTVVQNDTIWKIANVIYQTKTKAETGKFAKAILQANPALQDNANLLKIGMQLQLPPKEEAGKDVLPKNESTAKFAFPLLHVVQYGETLSGLAQKYYNNHSRWVEILHANPGLQGDYVACGTQIKIP